MNSWWILNQQRKRQSKCYQYFRKTPLASSINLGKIMSQNGDKSVDSPLGENPNHTISSFSHKNGKRVITLSKFSQAESLTEETDKEEVENLMKESTVEEEKKLPLKENKGEEENELSSNEIKVGEENVLSSKKKK